MEAVTFSTEDGVRLEGELRLPDGEVRGSAVICHPHPQHGGSKDHPILWALRNELASRRGLAVLAFNFRGVMGSGGAYGGGHDELDDVHAAITRVSDEAPDLPTIVLRLVLRRERRPARGDRRPSGAGARADRHAAATERPGSATGST